VTARLRPFAKTLHPDGWGFRDVSGAIQSVRAHTVRVHRTEAMMMDMPPDFTADPDRLLNEREAATFLGYTIRALQNWRLRGGGPTYVKVSERSIRYRRRELMAWVEKRLRTSTSDPGPGAHAD